MNYRKPATAAVVVTCMCLVISVFMGLSDAVVYTLTALALAAIVGLIYLTRHAGN